jgi:lipoprotein-anchoring transpeptidase ErfK/SrfK
MRERSLIILAWVLAFLFVGAGVVLAYDLHHENRIADGVVIGGVDVGGLEASTAHDRLSRELKAGLTEPIVVRGPKRSFRLTPRAAAATYDIDGMVDAAVRHSREGNIFVRTLRYVRGEPRPKYLPARLRYSKLVVNRFVARVDRAVSRKPVDAHLSFSGGYPHRRPGKEGLHVGHAELRSKVVAALTGRAPDRVVEVVPTPVKPKVLKADLARSYPYLITVDRPSFKLRLFRNLRHVKTYTIAVGQAGYDTPTGMYHIQNKAINPAWSVPNKPWAGSKAGQVIPGGTAENPLKARWMGIYDGAGIHGTDQTGSLGTRASHGCIRMAIPEVIELYDRVPVQTPVYIA